LFENREKINRLLGITKFLAMGIHDNMANRQEIQAVLSNNNITWLEAGKLTFVTNKNFVIG
jgi:hypothetical protein